MRTRKLAHLTEQPKSFLRSMGIACLCGLLATPSWAWDAKPNAGATAAQATQSQPQQKPTPATPAATPQKPAPTANPPVVVCPAGQHGVQQLTPFGPMNACVAD